MAGTSLNNFATIKDYVCMWNRTTAIVVGTATLLTAIVTILSMPEQISEVQPLASKEYVIEHDNLLEQKLTGDITPSIAELSAQLEVLIPEVKEQSAETAADNLMDFYTSICKGTASPKVYELIAESNAKFERAKGREHGFKHMNEQKICEIVLGL